MKSFAKKKTTKIYLRGQVLQQKVKVFQKEKYSPEKKLDFNFDFWKYSAEKEKIQNDHFSH